MSTRTRPVPDGCSLEVGSHQIAVVDGRAGRTGPPLVFVHGIALSAGLWPSLLQGTPLDECPWISLGLPGHFPSRAPAGFNRTDVTIPLFSDCVAVPVREFFGENPVHLIGWSTGGFASLAAAARQPETVASVVSLCGFARGKWGSHLGTMQWMAGRRFWNRVLISAMRLYGRSQRLFNSFLRSLAKRKAQLPADLTRILFDDYRQHDMRVMGELLAGIRKLDLSPLLADIKAPVLLLAGAADRVIPSSESEHLHENLPNSQLTEFPGVGHMFFAEALAENLAEIQQWIETH